MLFTVTHQALSPWQGVVQRVERDRRGDALDTELADVLIRKKAEPDLLHSMADHRPIVRHDTSSMKKGGGKRIPAVTTASTALLRSAPRPHALEILGGDTCLCVEMEARLCNSTWEEPLLLNMAYRLCADRGEGREGENDVKFGV